MHPVSYVPITLCIACGITTCMDQSTLFTMYSICKAMSIHNDVDGKYIATM